MRVRNESLAALLAEARWSAGELATSVNRLGSAQGLQLTYDRTSVAHWLSGSRPRRPVPDLVAAALSGRIGRLITPHASGLTQSTDIPTPGSNPHPSGPRSLQQLIDQWHADADPRRRVDLIQSAYRLSDLSLPGFRHPDLSLPVSCPAELGSATTSNAGRRPGRSDDAAIGDRVRTHQDMAHTFAQMADQHGGGFVQPLLAAYLGNTAGPHLAAEFPPGARGRELFTVTAQLTHLLAAMADDSGHFGLAQHYFRAALHLARTAADARQYAITMRAMSAQALRLRHIPEALQLAAAAVDLLGTRDDGAAQAFLYSQRAHANAVAGQRRAAREDLRVAEAHHERASAASGPFGSYPRAGLDYQRFQTLTALREVGPALAALESSAGHRTKTERKAAALTQAHLAETRLATGRLDSAIPHVQAFLAHYPLLYSAHADAARQRLDQALARFPRQPQAVALRNQIHAMARAVQPR